MRLGRKPQTPTVVHTVTSAPMSLAQDTDMRMRRYLITMNDAWVWDIYRPARFVKSVRVVTFKDVNIEELPKSELEMPS